LIQRLKSQFYSLFKKDSSGIVYVVRHGETDENSQKKLLGQKDVPLNENGIRQAHEVGQKIKKMDVDLIVSSTLIRAKQTAEIINLHIKKPLKLEPRLMERNLGVGEGLTLEEFQEKFQKGFNSKMAYNFTPPKGESAQEVQKRVFAVLDEIKKKYPGKKILIVTHSFVSRMIYKYFHPDISPEEFFDFHLKNIEVKKFKL